MLDEFQVWLVFGLAATAIVFLGLLGLNLLSSPYRMQREKAVNLEVELLKAKARLAEYEIRKPKLIIEPTYMAVGGICDDFPGMRSVFLSVNVYNIGTMPSIAKNWRLLVTISDNYTPIPPIIGPLSLGGKDPRTGVNTWHAKDWLHNKTGHVIEVGGMISGFMFALIEDLALSDRDSVRLVLTCRDVLDNQYSGGDEMIYGEGGDTLYMVGADFKSG